MSNLYTVHNIKCTSNCKFTIHAVGPPTRPAAGRPDRPPAGSVTGDNDRHQRAKQYWPIRRIWSAPARKLTAARLRGLL